MNGGDLNLTTRGQSVIAITSGFSTQECAMHASNRLKVAGLTVRVFMIENHGLDFEKQLRTETIAGVIDLTTSDLLPHRNNSDRLTSAGILGIPQIISVGGLDFHEMDNRPTKPDELDIIGKEIVQKACAARGPTRILLPLKGLSSRPQIDELNLFLFQSIRNWVYPPDMLIEREQHINDPEFGTFAAEELIKLMRLTS